MTSDTRNQYAEFCRITRAPLPLQPWWLDAVCDGGNWDTCMAFDAGGQLTGVLPYYRIRRWGLPVVQLPPLTTYAGPWLLYPPDPEYKRSSRYAFEKKVYTQLLRQLPRAAYFQQHFLPEVSNWLPFYWAGFRQTTRYTYLLEAPHDLQALHAGFSPELRIQLKKAGQATVIEPSSDAALLFRLHSMSFQRKGLQPPYSLETFTRLHAALTEREHAAGFVARSRQDGTPLAGLFLPYNGERASVLASGFDPRFSSSNALHGLYREAIHFCAARNIDLDFEGSMQPGIERVFRAFGARQAAYFRVWKMFTAPSAKKYW